MNDYSSGAAPRVAGTALIVAAFIVAVISNGSAKWAIGVPLVLALAGVGLRIEAALAARRAEQAQPHSFGDR